jgi:hypothetical protein
MSSTDHEKRAVSHGIRRKQKRDFRMERFAKEYAVDVNGRQAAIRAGFSNVSAATEASRLLNNPYVQRLVNEHLAKNAVLAELKAKEVIDGIRRNILRCEGVGENYRPLAALRGYEILGKHLKLFSQKPELPNPDALVARLHEGRKRAAGLSDS